MTSAAVLDTYLPAPIRTELEQAYYAQVNAQAHLDQAVLDPDFLDAPFKHVAFFSDHGVVHVRDVAQQILHVLDAIHGVLIPARSPSRLHFMKGYGVMLAYLHDIGMLDFSPYGRAMHPEFAAQEVFKPNFDPILQTIWAENWGNIAWRLLNLANEQVLSQNPQLVLREMLALAMVHSKSKVAIATLNQPTQLRKLMQTSLNTELNLLYQQQQVTKIQRKLTTNPGDRITLQADLDHAMAAVEQAATRPHPLAETLLSLYPDFVCDAFGWLLNPHPAMQPLLADVLDTLRALRCADALRQRGTVLNTSGGYQIFVDARSANAIHAFKKGADEMLILLETDDAIAAGEANVASSELTPQGDLRVSFHRGAFSSPTALQRAIKAAAIVIDDIQADVITSFRRPGDEADAATLKSDRNIQILLEGVDDNPDFATLVSQQLTRLNPDLAGRCRPVSSLQGMSDQERERYLHGEALAWDQPQKQAALGKIAASGHKVDEIDVEVAFAEVKRVTIETGLTLIEAGSPPGFVYIPLDEGLKGTPLGGYRPFPVYPWTPLGNTGVIRGAVRNATIVAEKPVSLLAIPKEIYLKYWHFTYDKASFSHLMRQIYGLT